MTPLPPRLAYAIITTVTVVWLANFCAQFIPGIEYQPDPLIHGIFGAIVGGTIALSRKPPGGPPGPDTPSTPPQVVPGPEEGPS